MIQCIDRTQRGNDWWGKRRWWRPLPFKPGTYQLGHESNITLESGHRWSTYLAPTTLSSPALRTYVVGFHLQKGRKNQKGRNYLEAAFLAPLPPRVSTPSFLSLLLSFLSSFSSDSSRKWVLGAVDWSRGRRAHGPKAGGGLVSPPSSAAAAPPPLPPLLPRSQFRLKSERIFRDPCCFPVWFFRFLDICLIFMLDDLILWFWQKGSVLEMGLLLYIFSCF